MISSWHKPYIAIRKGLLFDRISTEGTSFREYGYPCNTEVRLTDLPESLKTPMDTMAEREMGRVRDKKQGTFRQKERRVHQYWYLLSNHSGRTLPWGRGRVQDAAVCGTIGIETHSGSTPDTVEYFHGTIIENNPTQGPTGITGRTVPPCDAPEPLVSYLKDNITSLEQYLRKSWNGKFPAINAMKMRVIPGALQNQSFGLAWLRPLPCTSFQT